MVTVIGSKENVDECIDHLLNLLEEYMQDIVEKEDMEMYMAPSAQGQHDGGHNPQTKKEVSFCSKFISLMDAVPLVHLFCYLSSEA